jgi:recombination protein RecA
MSYSDVIKKWQKAWKCEKPLVNSVFDVQRERIPFSSPLLNWVTYGGIPRNRYIELYGPESSGKSTTTLDLCNNAAKLFRQEYEDKIAELQQKLADGDKDAEDMIDELQEMGPKRVVYLDIENAFDVTWAKTIGLDFDDEDNNLDVIQPPNVVAEDVLQFTREAIESGQVGLVAMDSIAALIPKAMLGKDIGERTVAALAGLLAVFFPIVIPLLTRYKCTLITINQTRDNLLNPYVDKTPGGQAPRFYASLRAKFRKGKFVDFLGNDLPNNAENPAGCIIEMQMIKQKTAPNDRRLGTYYLMTDSGIRPDFDYAMLAMRDYSLIRKSGGWYSFVDPDTGEVIEGPDGKPKKVNGMANVYSYLSSNPEYYKKLKKYIMDDINGKSDDSDGEETD